MINCNLRSAVASTTIVMSLCAAFPAIGASLLSVPPAAGISGVQADEDGTGPLEQNFTGARRGTLESIAWWGYHGPNSGGPALDAFSVVLNGVARFGSLSTSADPVATGLSRYELDIPDVAFDGGSGTLSLVNGTGTEWFWQDASAGSGQAFELIGTPSAAPLPEPGSLALLLAGILPLAARWARPKG